MKKKEKFFSFFQVEQRTDSMYLNRHSPTPNVKGGERDFDGQFSPPRVAHRIKMYIAKTICASYVFFMRVAVCEVCVSKSVEGKAYITFLTYTPEEFSLTPPRPHTTNIGRFMKNLRETDIGVEGLT